MGFFNALIGNAGVVDSTELQRFQRIICCKEGEGDGSSGYDDSDREITLEVETSVWQIECT